MKRISDIYKKTGKLHHAYCLEGDCNHILPLIIDFLEKDLKFNIQDNPDYWYGNFNVLKIDDARSIKNKHQNKPIVHDRKVFIISTNFITKDAQNSLLKIFEEPSADTVFFLVLPSATNLLPTLRSRLIVFNIDNPVSDDNEVSVAKKFLKSKVGDRLKMTKKIIDDISDEKSNKADVIRFLKSLEKEMHILIKGKKLNIKNSRFEDIEKAISYLNDESASIKVILDHLALVL